MVEPRYDRLSTEGAFLGTIRRDLGNDAGGEDSTSPAPAPALAASIWPFRRLLEEYSAHWRRRVRRDFCCTGYWGGTD
ncbi:uncharacterized protein BDV17DRAFT_248642 [Aspergillus undulatus]|uniref:uncharacterized protein n=1 Tax=Aspergillus undulatus TaxID=1810928 RepID=UPI003CCCDA76